MLHLIAALGLLAASLGEPTLFADAQPTADTLVAMRELPVGHLGAGDQVFRFLWLRSRHRPILVQLKRQGRRTSVQLKALDSAWSLSTDGVHVGKLMVEKESDLGADAWDRMAEMRRATFWGRPSGDSAAEGGLDGAMWILEGRSWGEYHIVERWSPTEGPFREMCLEMLKLAGVRLSDERVY